MRAAIVLTVLLYGLSAPLSAADAARRWGQGQFEEELRYSWRLTGIAGAVVGLFYPRSGDAVLTSLARGEDALITELEVTSPERGPDEYYRYGAETDASALPKRVWASYRFKGKSKDKQLEIGDREVRELASTIQFLRLERPQKPVEVRLWSEGTEYDVVVMPQGATSVALEGAEVPALHYRVEGLRHAGEKRFKPRFEIWIVDDPRAAPARMVATRGVLRLQLDLVN